MFPSGFWRTGYFPSGYWSDAIGVAPQVVPGRGGGAGVATQNLPPTRSRTRPVIVVAEVGTVRPTILATRPVRWVLREGVQPVIQTFDIRAADRDRILAGPDRKMTLAFLDGTGKELARFHELWILDFPPGPNEFISQMRVADRRWFWAYGRVLRRFNMRRRTGVKRAPNPVAELRALIPEVQYANYSLKDQETGRKWTAREAIDVVLAEIFEKEVETVGGTRPGIIFAPELLEKFQTLPIEDLQIDDRGDQALARLLSYIPGASLFINRIGDVVLFQKADGSEEIPVFLAGPEIVGDGHIEPVKNVLTRPRSVKVQFTYEVEVRFDFAEQSGTTIVRLTEKQKESSRRVDNVLPIPDFSLDVKRFNGQETQEEAQGTYITVDEALASWRFPIFGELTHDVIRRAFMPFMDLWGSIARTGQLTPKLDIAGRVAALMQHYRRTFKIPQRWVDNYLSARAYRISTIDRATGSRGAPQVYADWAIVGSQRAFFGAGGRDRREAFHIANYKGYQDVIDENTVPIPATLNIIDQDQGIVSFDFLQDPGKVFTVFLPGTVTGPGTNPTGNIQLANRLGSTIAFDASPSGSTIVSGLDANWKCSFIVTLVPASPNDKRQLHEIEVKPEHVRDLLPSHVLENLAEGALGPSLEVRIPASVETARVRWLDGDASKIQAIFGVGLPDGADPPDLARLIVNRTGTGVQASGGASLENIARASAAAVYTEFVDRLEGEMAAKMEELIEPSGALSEVAYELVPSGKATVNLSLPDEPPVKFDFFGFLDEGTRAVVMRLVQGRPA